jgi:alpha-tubulin suppressor-like RCC1 family protein
MNKLVTRTRSRDPLFQAKLSLLLAIVLGLYFHSVNAHAGTVLAAGLNHSLAVKPDGTLWAWGDKSNGEIGVGSTAPYYYPTQVASLSAVQSVSAGYNFSVALTSDATVWVWGSNTYGQVGDGTTTQRASPVQVTGLSAVTAVSAGYQFCLALKSDGSVWAWGCNSSGQLGMGRQTNAIARFKSWV